MLPAVYVLGAWRVMLLSRVGKTCVDLDWEVMFEAMEWRSVYTIVKKQPPIIDYIDRQNRISGSSSETIQTSAKSSSLI